MQCAVSSIESNQQDFASNIRYYLTPNASLTWFVLAVIVLYLAFEMRLQTP